jgi:hypothetical protein
MNAICHSEVGGGGYRRLGRDHSTQRHASSARVGIHPVTRGAVGGIRGYTTS